MATPAKGSLRLPPHLSVVFTLPGASLDECICPFELPLATYINYNICLRHLKILSTMHINFQTVNIVEAKQ
jgi:hypothetical protein